MLIESRRCNTIFSWVYSIRRSRNWSLLVHSTTVSARKNGFKCRFRKEMITSAYFYHILYLHFFEHETKTISVSTWAKTVSISKLILTACFCWKYVFFLNHLFHWLLVILFRQVRDLFTSGKRSWIGVITLIRKTKNWKADHGINEKEKEKKERDHLCEF